MEQLLCIGVCVRELRVQVGNHLSVDVGENKRGGVVIMSPISGRGCPPIAPVGDGEINPRAS